MTLLDYISTATELPTKTYIMGETQVKPSEDPETVALIQAIAAFTVKQDSSTHYEYRVLVDNMDVDVTIRKDADRQFLVITSVAKAAGGGFGDVWQVPENTDEVIPSSNNNI